MDYLHIENNIKNIYLRQIVLFLTLNGRKDVYVVISVLYLKIIPE